MSITEFYKIIKRPIITEKTTNLKKQNKYIFEVDINANKSQIKQALEKLFNVDVKEVKTIIMKGKLRRYGKYEGYRPDWKKAIVKLKPGQTIKQIEELQ